MERLDRQVDAYVAWKRDLIREITRYRSWLAHSWCDIGWEVYLS